MLLSTYISTSRVLSGCAYLWNTKFKAVAVARDLAIWASVLPYSLHGRRYCLPRQLPVPGNGAHMASERGTGSWLQPHQEDVKRQVLRGRKCCLCREIGTNHVGKSRASSHLTQLRQPALWVLSAFCAGFTEQFGRFLGAKFINCYFIYKLMQFIRYCMVSWVFCKRNW